MSMFHPPAIPEQKQGEISNMFHVKHIFGILKEWQWRAGVKQFKIHELLFYIFLFLLPIQTRILYSPSSAYISWYFNYHLALFVYGTDLLILIFGLSWLILDRPSFTWNKITALICLFIGIVMLSLFHVKHLDLAWYGLFKWLELLLIFGYIAKTFKTQAQFIISAWIVYLSAIFQAILGIWQFHVQHGLGFGLLGEYIAPFGTSGLATIDTTAGKIIRAYGTMPHPNVLAAFLIFGLMIGLFLVSRGTKLQRILVSLGLIILTLGIFLTFSRLAWLAGAIGFLCFGIYYLLQKQSQNIIILFLVALVSCGTIFLAYRSDLQARASDTKQTSITDRYFFDQVGLKLLATNPILGTRVGNYVPAMEQMYQLEPWQYQPPHNYFIFFGAELGWPALLIFLIFLWEIIRRAGRAEPGALKFTLLGLGGLVLLLAQFDHYFATIQQGRLMFFVLFGLIAALPNLDEIEKSN